MLVRVRHPYQLGKDGADQRRTSPGNCLGCLGSREVGRFLPRRRFEWSAAISMQRAGTASRVTSMPIKSPVAG
jgi:hypothetical protein